MGGLSGLYGFCNTSNLVHFEKKRVAGVLFNGGGDALRVGHKEIIPNDLALASHCLCQQRVRVPVVLVEWILDGDHRILLNELLVELDELRAEERREIIEEKVEQEVPGILTERS